VNGTSGHKGAQPLLSGLLAGLSLLAGSGTALLGILVAPLAVFAVVAYAWDVGACV
jgi:hypothetical protein